MLFNSVVTEPQTKPYGVENITGQSRSGVPLNYPRAVKSYPYCCLRDPESGILCFSGSTPHAV